MSSNSFKIKITFKLFTYNTNLRKHLIVCKQMSGFKLNRYCYIEILETI